MNSSISAFITKTLCEHQGCLNASTLQKLVARRFPAAVDPDLLRSVFVDDSKTAIRPGKQAATRGLSVGPDSLVVAKTSLRLCQKKPGECPECDALHLCKFFVCGDCTFGNKCKNSHTLASAHNAQLLKRHGLQDLTEKQLFRLLLQNDPFLLPEICPHYNKGNGEHGTCRFTNTCTKLHTCQHFLQGDCKFGASCKRTHNIDAQGARIFRGLSQENMNNLPEIYRNKSIITGQSAAFVPPPPSKVRVPTQQSSSRDLGSPASSAGPSKPMTEADRSEICLFFIRGHCSFKDKCVRVHRNLPYSWQVLDTDGVTWKDLPNMEDIEKAYCDPANGTHCTAQQSVSGIFSFLRLQGSVPAGLDSVDFMTMKYKGSPVRRLSTASAVSKPPYFIHTTQWLWHWKDEGGKWQEFGQGQVDTAASVTSETLENIYLANRDAPLPFSAGSQQYVLHFNGGPGTPPMYQENLKYKTKREVRRRPCFVSEQDVKMKLDSVSSHSSGSSLADTVPSYWDKTALPELGYKLVPLSKSAKDYEMIVKLFNNTMPLRKVTSIQRIQNPSLWKVFQWQKEQMTGRNKGKPVNQQYLFHGTDESLVGAICEQNFDWRMCGVHGVAYGKGSYFAKDSSYSDNYAVAKKTLNKVMFVALVLVGEYCKGTSSLVRPPSKGTSGNLYDSCVNCERNPSIFVIFEKHQIYPEYLINYS
ncbi:poly [ADP-ribose] polymerase 12 [Solea senegalensis]|uniref:Poly [ADP-ribose] polymerase 12 n=1 Tax=Solea senegalensis TaxID=28829 RepID=A0AAV6T0F1_SOLSE|nr:protein mono-ADP-ribosyltransferase PARP12 [Solea senegalensis]KAG7522867.1 poly [ADP-ribose] polymerase 12 [Solea senegalensis]